MVGIRVFGAAACEGMERESCIFGGPDKTEVPSAAAGRVDERGSIPPARALSLEVRPRRV